MEREKGIAYCGLACCVCSENVLCPGCRSGGCPGRETCKPFNCCIKNRWEGCWECPQFPCGAAILQKTRIQVFADFAKEYGMDSLIDALEKNQCRGVVYHYPNLLMGDYDSLSSQQEILHLLLNGPQDRIKGGIFMQSFIPWLDRIMAGPLPEEIIAVNFNLYDDGDSCWSMEFIGTRSFDADDPDWACDEVFISRDSTLHWVQNTGWQQVLEDTVHTIRAYLANGTYSGRLKAYQGIGAGFVDGDIVILYETPKE